MATEQTNTSQYEELVAAYNAKGVYVPFVASKLVHNADVLPEGWTGNPVPVRMSPIRERE